MLPIMLLCASQAFGDRVSWTDGREWNGKVELGEGAAISLHDGRHVRTWKPEEVARIVFEPGTQRMERAWRFLEAGKTAKEFSGEPYPTLELLATVSLRSGESARGHLMTTVFYLTREGRTEKLILAFKLRGREGQKFADLTYAREISFEADSTVGAGKPGGAGRCRVAVAGGGVGIELAAVSRAKMEDATVARDGTNAFSVRLDGGDVIVGVKSAEKIAVGWRGQAAAPARARIEQGVRDLRDFFDDRHLLATSQDQADETTCHTLMLLSRAGKTTYDAKASQPWRLEVWKWRVGADTNDITAASRCVLFRGIRAPDAPLPEITLSPALGKVEAILDGMTLEVGEAQIGGR